VSEDYRLASCERCHVQLRFCRVCDRGQRFCPICVPAQRRDSLRRAGATYRIKKRARRLQSTRQARYRERRDKFSDPKVTHHSVTQASPSSISPPVPDVSSGRKEIDDDSNREAARCSVCGVVLPVWARRGRRALLRRSPRVPRGPPP
jgi:hypothetical protein